MKFHEILILFFFTVFQISYIDYIRIIYLASSKQLLTSCNNLNITSVESFKNTYKTFDFKGIVTFPSTHARNILLTTVVMKIFQHPTNIGFA